MTETTRSRFPRAALPALAPQLITDEVLLEKYAKGDEKSADDIRLRVARALAQVEAPEQRATWETRFLDAQQRGFIPAGRISSAAGTALSATLINCFVQPVGDSIATDEEGHPSAAARGGTSGRRTRGAAGRHAAGCAGARHARRRRCLPGAGSGPRR